MALPQGITWDTGKEWYDQPVNSQTYAFAVLKTAPITGGDENCIKQKTYQGDGFTFTENRTYTNGKVSSFKINYSEDG